jgi:flavin reductase (DIM6/NTAB) family NADH-FMN oxidoreductase RutF
MHSAADEYFYEPVNGHGLKHDPFASIVGPRPIGWISTIDDEGVLNLAPHSFFNAFNYSPPIIGFASVGSKDTLRNVQLGGEFCWSLATESLAEQVNLTSAMVPRDVDEFALAGLTPAASRIIGVPRVLESPVAFECRLTQVLQLASSTGGHVDTWLVLGEVVGVHIERCLLAGEVYDTAAAHPILRAGGAGEYFRISREQSFSMHRPR